MTRKSLPRHKLLPIHKLLPRYKLLPRHKLLPPHKYSKIPDITQASPIRNRQAGCAIPPYQILYAPCRLSSSITSGAKPPSHTLLPPQVSHQAQIRPSVHFSFLKCHIRKMPTCPSPQAVPVGSPIVFPMCHIRSGIALPHTFPSSSYTSGKHHPAPQSLLRHIPVFLMCHIRSEIALPRSFPSPSVTSGKNDSINQRGRLC